MSCRVLFEFKYYLFEHPRKFESAQNTWISNYPRKLIHAKKQTFGDRKINQIN